MENTTALKASREEWGVAIAFENWARACPQDAVEAVRQGLAEDNINASSIPVRALRLFAFHEAVIEEDRSRAIRLGVKPLGNVLGDTVSNLSHEITLAIYARQIEAHRRDFNETGNFGPARDWNAIREHFTLDAEGRKIEHGPPGEETQSGVGEEATNNPSIRLRPCDLKAFQQYEHAVRQSDPPVTADRDAYDWLQAREEGDSLPTFFTWQRYVRKYRNAFGSQKNKPRTNRQHGGSIVHSNEREYQPEAD